MCFPAGHATHVDCVTPSAVKRTSMPTQVIHSVWPVLRSVYWSAAHCVHSDAPSVGATLSAGHAKQRGEYASTLHSIALEHTGSAVEVGVGGQSVRQRMRPRVTCLFVVVVEGRKRKRRE